MVAEGRRPRAITSPATTQIPAAAGSWILTRSETALTFARVMITRRQAGLPDSFVNNSRGNWLSDYHPGDVQTSERWLHRKNCVHPRP